jgi:hypothetical protein
VIWCGPASGHRNPAATPEARETETSDGGARQSTGKICRRPA